MPRDVESKGGNGAPSGAQAETDTAGPQRADNLRLAAVFLDHMVIPAAGSARHERLVSELRQEGFIVGAETVSLDALKARSSITLEEAVQSEQAAGPTGNTPTPN